MTSITSLDEDAYIMVATNGLLGEKYLKVVPGGGVNYLKRVMLFQIPKVQWI